jgi:shikimate kinase
MHNAKESDMNVQIAETASLSTEAQLPSMPASLRRVVLTGFMGAGKTTVGRLLAQRLGWEFLDLDAHIEQRSGLAVPAIFAIHGEEHFRRLESTALVSALGRKNLVLALGGGTPEQLTNRLLLEQTPGTAAIFLDAPFSALFDRCMLQALNALPTLATADPIRPLLSDPAAAESRFHTRHPIYRRLARVTLQTAELTPEQTVDTLFARLSSL